MEEGVEKIEIEIKCEVIEVSDGSDDEYYEPEPKVKRKEARKKGPYQCEECSKLFKKMVYLTRHMRTHTGKPPPKNVQCSECSKMFENNGLLKRHMDTHMGDKRDRSHICASCGKGYTQSGHLKEHELKHHGNAGKAFKCTICDAAFFRNTDLGRHMRIHTGEKKFTCPHCDKSFVQKCNLDMHIRTHTGDRRFECTECDKKYITNSRLMQHYKRHEKKKEKEKLKKEKDCVLIQKLADDDSLSSVGDNSET